MSEYTDIAAYLKEIISKNKKLKGAKQFFQSLAEATEKSSNNMDPLAFVLSSVSGRIVNQHENKFDNKTVEFHIIRKCKTYDFNNVRAAKQECFDLGMQIFAKIEEQTIGENNYFSPDSIQYTEVDKMFDNYAGIRFTFNPNFENYIEVDPDDWEE